MDDAIVDALAELRIKQGLTQKAMAARAGVTQASVSRWESGDRSPRLSDLRRYAAALGVELTLTAKEAARA